MRINKKDHSNESSSELAIARKSATITCMGKKLKGIQTQRNSKKLRSQDKCESLLCEKGKQSGVL